MTIYYICDRRACDKCMKECTHTSDIRHAAHLEVTERGDIFESHPSVKPSDDIVIADDTVVVKSKVREIGV